MRKIGILKSKLVRLSPKLDKFTFLDSVFHLFGIHLIRISGSRVYCRYCKREF